MSEKKKCPDCGVDPEAIHYTGCDVERCPDCGGQKISCGCDSKRPSLPWTGVWPGIMEATEFGWFAYFDSKDGWVKCPPSDPRGKPDLNRLYADAIWDRAAGRFFKISYSD